jgi:endo-1,4-beta-D-glucanase Y
MQEILRKLIWTQNYEISLMEQMIKTLPKNDMSEEKNMKKKYIPNKADFIKPNKLELTNTYCDPHFFNPEFYITIT